MCSNNENDFDWMYDIPNESIQEWYELFYPRRNDKRLYEVRVGNPFQQIEIKTFEWMECPDEGISSSSSPSSVPSTSSSPTFEIMHYERPSRRNGARHDRINVWGNKNQTNASSSSRNVTANNKAFKISKWIQPSKNKYCSFCYKNQEMPSVYNSHFLRSSDGQITCPVLLEIVCSHCGATGQEAHTPNYCPKKSIVNVKNTSKHVLGDFF